MTTVSDSVSPYDAITLRPKVHIQPDHRMVLLFPCNFSLFFIVQSCVWNSTETGSTLVQKIWVHLGKNLHILCSFYKLGLISVLQIVIWIVIPATREYMADYANNTLALIVLIQYIPRLFLIFPLNQRIIKTTGVIAKTAWAGAAYNLLLYILASHVYILSPIVPI